MVKLGVNIDHVATVRQARGGIEPDPVWAASEAELGGADGITFHLREDRRHIQDRDARLLKETVAAKLNMEMSIAAAIVRMACELRPQQCTLVPERRAELTTEGGLDVRRLASRVRRAVARLQAKGIAVSAFIEPDPAQIESARDCGFDGVELWTGGYSHARTPAAVERATKSLERALALGLEYGLEVHAGHGLNYHNTARLASIAGFSEFNIGHSIVARAVFVGLRQAVQQMKDILGRHTPRIPT